MATSSLHTPMNSVPAQVGSVARHLTTVTSDHTRASRPYGPVRLDLIFACLALLSLTLLPTATAQVNFTPYTWPLARDHNSLGQVMSKVSNEKPDWFADHRLNTVELLRSKTSSDDTYTSEIKWWHKVLVDVTLEDEEECNHIEMLGAGSALAGYPWIVNTRRHSKNCRVERRAMRLSNLLDAESLEDVRFH